MPGPFHPSTRACSVCANVMSPRSDLRLPLDVYAESGLVFSVTIGTKPRAPVFADLVFSRECVEALRALADSRGNQVFAYCLMPDHVHLLIGVGAQASLIAFVQAWKSQCYRARRARGHPQTFWQRRFWDHVLRTNEDIRTVALYILCNPVRKGLVDDFRAYPLCGSFVFELGD